MVGKQASVSKEIKSIYNADEGLRTVESTERLVESLRGKVEKLKDDEWMYSSTDTLFSRGEGKS